MTIWFSNFRFFTSNRTVISERSYNRHQSKSLGKSEGNVILLWKDNEDVNSFKRLKKNLVPSIKCYYIGSEGKESAYNVGDPGIPGSGGSPGEGNAYTLQYSFLKNPVDGGVWQVTVHGVTKSRTWLTPSLFTFIEYYTSCISIYSDKQFIYLN